MASNSRGKRPNRETVMKLWLAAGGRCQFEGCNKRLYCDDLTWEEFNGSNIAHLIASSPDGPRGNAKSNVMSDNIENLMLLCPMHHKEIRSGEFGIFNKNVYAGLKLDSDRNVSVITKDVDFCIGKKVEVEIKDTAGHSTDVQIIVPIVAVEVKTYLDATMFGEIKSSSGAIRSASPNSRTYVLMGYKDLKDEHIIAARQDSTLTEMFALRAGQGEPIDADALYDYWKEVSDAIKSVSTETKIKVPGRLLHADE